MTKVRLDGKKVYALAEELRRTASEVSRNLVSNPGGDTFVYVGSMNDVEWMREAIEAFEDYKRFGER